MDEHKEHRKSSAKAETHDGQDKHKTDEHAGHEMTGDTAEMSHEMGHGAGRYGKRYAETILGLFHFGYTGIFLFSPVYRLLQYSVTFAVRNF